MAGLSFAQACVQQIASLAARELADRVNVKLLEGTNGFLVTCGKRSARVPYAQDDEQVARGLERAVETVLGLQETEGSV